MEWTVGSIDEESVYNLGLKLADYIRPGVVFCISGDLGSGKTTLARAIISNAGKISGDIPSPTFNLVQSYVVADFEIGFGKIGLPLRLALTATVNSPSIDLVCQLLGKDITLFRIEKFLTKIQDLKTDQ